MSKKNLTFGIVAALLLCSACFLVSATAEDSEAVSISDLHYRSDTGIELKAGVSDGSYYLSVRDGGDVEVYGYDVKATDGSIQSSRFAGKLATGQTYTAKLFDSDYDLLCKATFGTYTVSFDKNGGTGSMGDLVVSGTFVLPDCGFSMENHGFAGWSETKTDTSGKAAGETYTVTSDTTLYATWALDVYTITWIVGETKTTTQAAYGATPVYPGSTPTKEPSAQYTYTFKEWTPAVAEVTGDATYTALFTETLRTYTVTLTSNNDAWGSLTETSIENVPYGSLVSVSGNTLTVYGRTVTASPSPSSEGKNHSFSEWSIADGYEIAGPTEVTATFAQSDVVCKVALKVADGQTGWGGLSAYSIEGVVYGTQITVDGNKLTIGSVEVTATPSPETPQYAYSFASWSVKTGDKVVEDLEITATFGQTLREYTITWNVDGTTTTTQVAYGGTPSYGGTPTKEPSAQYTYRFSGWDPEIGSVTGNATYTALFIPTLRTYEVTFDANSGEGTMDKEVVSYGKYTLPTECGFTCEGKRFVGWSLSSTGDVVTEIDVTGDTTVYAVWEQLYDVVFKNGDAVFKTISDVIGASVVAPEAPSRAGYVFVNWEASDGSTLDAGESFEIVGDATYSAEWIATSRLHVVKLSSNDGGSVGLYDEDGNPIASGTQILHGSKVTVRISLNEGYGLKSITDNGKDVTGSVSDSEYTFAVTAGHDIVVTFAPLHTISIDINGGTMGDVTSGDVTIEDGKCTLIDGSSATFTVKAKDGYVIDSVTSESGSVQIGKVAGLASGTFAVSGISGDVAVEVTFRAAETYTVVEPEKTPKGDVSVEGLVDGKAVEGRTIKIVVTPAFGYYIGSITVNGLDPRTTTGGESYEYTILVNSFLAGQDRIVIDVSFTPLDDDDDEPYPTPRPTPSYDDSDDNGTAKIVAVAAACVIVAVIAVFILAERRD